MPIKLELKKTKVPVKIWTEDVESEALNQATLIADNMPVSGHLALMPDVHAGMGMPIGGVLPLKNTISPNCVGVDIGCGMFSMQFNLTEIPIEQQKKIYGLLRQRIPVGFNKRPEPVNWMGFEDIPESEVIKRETDAARKQLGTLGGGNHFLEFQKGDDGYIWVTIHSGSRNIGKQTCDYYHRLAVEKGIVPGGIKQLAYFKFDSDLGQEYRRAMEFCLDFALENRRVMAEITAEAVQEVLPLVEVKKQINIHHNYAAVESHLGEEVVVHRKGATKASEETVGVIPGSQGAPTYIVAGKGNLDSFSSCSHGAGRKMSRTKAKQTISREEYIESMRRAGLECSDREIHIDEAPGAYKDIDQVIGNQHDLIRVLTKLTPYQLPAIKG